MESIVACKGTRLMVVRTIASQLAFTGAWIDHLVGPQDRSKVKSVGQFLKNDLVPVEMATARHLPGHKASANNTFQKEGITTSPYSYMHLH